MNPLVSVIVLAYNHRDTIARALDSVLDQDCSFTYEIIVGDDASTDGCREVCERYAAAHPDKIRILPAAPNKGMVRNYFDCLKASRGKYIADCSGDDRWRDPTKLRIMAGLLEADPSLTAAYSDALIVKPDAAISTASMAEYAPWRGGRHCGKEILLGALNHTRALPYILSTALYRKSAVEQVMAAAPEMVCNESFGLEDVPVIAALASKGDAVHIAADTLEYVQGTETVSRSNDLSKLAGFYTQSLRCSRKLARFYGIPQSELRDIHDDKAVFLTACAFNSGSEELRRRVEAELGKWTLKLPFKANLYLMLMKSQTLWKLSRRIKRLFKNKC